MPRKSFILLVACLGAALFAGSRALSAHPRQEPAPAAGDAIQELLANARKSYSKPIAAEEPAPPELKEWLGLIQQGQYDAAAERLEAAVAQNPDRLQPRMFLALAHHQAKRYTQARPLWEDFLRRKPTFDTASLAFYYYAWCLYYLGETAGSRAAFEAFKAVDGKRYREDVEFGLGLNAMAEGDLPRAKTHLARSLALVDEAGGPTRSRALSQAFAKAHGRLGNIAMLEDDLEAARTHLEACVRAAPNSHEAWFLLYRLYTRLGETELAQQAKAAHERAKG